jgi:hypothetical protein
MIGDICGRPGRRLVKDLLPGLRREHGAALVIANGENAAGGVGITEETAEEIFAAGVDVITGGNHTWHNREAYALLDGHPRLLRPANYPPGAPGRGALTLETPDGPVAVLNLQGRVFMGEIDDPFRAAERWAEELRQTTPVIIVDFHAEATSEKIALGWHLDGKVSAVLGTHTHVQTADERLLPEGTAYITDVGMTGPRDGVIGMDRGAILEHFLSGLPTRFTVARGPAQLNGVALEIDGDGRARAITRVQVTREDGE